MPAGPSSATRRNSAANGISTSNDRYVSVKPRLMPKPGSTPRGGRVSVADGADAVALMAAADGRMAVVMLADCPVSRAVAQRPSTRPMRHAVSQSLLRCVDLVEHAAVAEEFRLRGFPAAETRD